MSFFYLGQGQTQHIFILIEDTEIIYVDRSATASINVGSDSYFDNLTILEQFERIFQLLEFKEVYKNHSIEIVVDNARTHTAKSHTVYDFSKGIGTKCPVDKIDYTDSKGKAKVLHCKFQDGEFLYQEKPALIGARTKRLRSMKIICSGEHNGKTKGLIEIAKELKIKFHPKIKLDDLRELLSEHPAFKTVRNIYSLGE